MGGWSGATWCHTRKKTEYNDSGLDAVWEELQAKTMRKCWDFWHRMRKVPESIRYNAFFNVYDKLLPTLAHTMWPAGQEFDFVHQAFLICQVVIVCFKPRLNNMLMRCPRTKDTYLAPMQNRLPQKRSCQISPPKVYIWAAHNVITPAFLAQT